MFNLRPFAYDTYALNPDPPPPPAARYGHQVTADEIEQFGEDALPESSPTLDQFREQIDSYERIYLEMEQVEPVVTLDTWLRLDCKPFKVALLNTIRRWSLLFKQYLVDHVTNRSAALESQGWIRVLGVELDRSLTS